MCALPYTLLTEFVLASHNVKRHIIEIHLALKPHRCMICGAAFARSDNRNKHVLNKHKIDIKPKKGPSAQRRRQKVDNTEPQCSTWQKHPQPGQNSHIVLHQRYVPERLSFATKPGLNADVDMSFDSTIALTEDPPVRSMPAYQHFDRSGSTVGVEQRSMWPKLQAYSYASNAANSISDGLIGLFAQLSLIDRHADSVRPTGAPRQNVPVNRWR